MKLSHVLVPVLMLSMFAGCEEERKKKKNDDPASACDAICACEACTDAELEACQAQEQALQDQASQTGCEDELDAYLSCGAENGECVNGQYGAVGCDDELAAYATCGGGGCSTVNDGVCDEPEGTGTCAEGSDPVDCGGGTCATTNNGQCDEPEGTGTCAEGTDVADCASSTCPYTYDGKCDEPEGTGYCLEGTDVADCSASTCPYTNNGQCDEPEGSGLCPEGTDVADCSGPQSCDSMGVCGDFQSGCIACAAESTCSLQYNTCMNNPECLSYNDCLQGCTDQACYDLCDTTYPTGSAQFNDMANCIVCDACPISCDGAGSGC